ncbi:MAG: tetratricopeptide repeat protein, partial [Candidatus Hydrogenedens sp.]
MGLRVLYLSDAIKNPDFSAPLHDAEFKDYWARAILSGNYTPPRNEGNPFMEGHPLPNPPGYPLFLALIYWLTEGSYLAVRWVQICIGLLNIFLVYLLGKNLFDYKAGLFSALGVATYWAFVHYDMELNQVTIFITINLLCFNLLLQAYKKNKLGLLSLAGLIFGMGAWFRGEVFILIFPLTIFVMFLFFHPGRLKTVFYTGLLFLVSALLSVLPLSLYNYYLCGSFTSGSHNSECSISIAFHPDTPEYGSYTPEMLRWLNKTPEDTVEIFDLDGMTLGLGKQLGLERRATYKEWKNYLISGAIHNIKTYPWLNLKKCLKRFLWTFSPQELDENKVIYYEREVSTVLKYLPRFPLAMSLFTLSLILLVISLSSKGAIPIKISTCSWKFIFVLLFFVATNISIFSLLIAGSRYRISLLPYFFIFGGIVFSSLWETVSNKRWNWATLIIFGFLILFSLAHVPFFDYQPNRSRWLDERRKCYQRIGKIAEGVQFFEKWLEKHSDADAHYHAGVLCYELNELTKAEEHFYTCLKLSPDHPSAPYNLGLIFAKRGDWAKAGKYFEEAVKRNPSKADMWFALGWATENSGDLSTALEHYTHALNINPHHTQALNHSAVIMFQKGEGKTAKQHLEQAIRIDPNYVDARFNLGQILLAERKPADALKQFMTVKGKYQPEHELLKCIGLCYVQMLDYKEALNYLLKAKGMNPEKWDAEDSLAVCYAGLGMREECIRTIEILEDKLSNSIQVFNLGHAWELLGEWDKAETYYKTVIEKDKNNADTYAGLG